MGCALTVYLLLMVSVNTDACQKWMGRVVGEQLTDFLHARVSVERVAVGLFNQVTLFGVELDDTQGGEVLRGDYVSAKVELMPLITDQRVRLRTVALLDTKVNLAKHRDGKLNIQYLIDAFSNPNDTTPSKLDLKAGVVIMRRCMVNYDDALRPHSSAHLSDIDLNVSLRYLTTDSLNLRMRHCSLKEQRGLELTGLSFSMAAGSKGGEVKNLRIEMPHSFLTIPQLTAHYDGRGTMSDIWHTLMVRPTELHASLATADVQSILPTDLLEKLGGSPVVNLELQAELAAERLRVNSLELHDNQGRMSVVLNGALHLPDGKPHDGQVVLKSVRADMGYAASIIEALTRKPMPTAIAALETIDLTGSATMADPEHGFATVALRSAVGDVTATADLKGDVVTAKVASANLQPNKLAAGADVPTLVDFDANGSVSMNGKLATAALNVNHLYWRGDDYANIQANGSIRNSDFSVHLTADNKLMGLALTASGDTRLENASVSADIDHWGALLPRHIVSLKGGVEAELHNVLTKCPLGKVEVKDLVALTNIDDVVSIQRMQQMTVQSRPSNSGVNIDVRSDFMHAQFNGQIDIPAIKATALQILHNQLPGLVVPKAMDIEGNRWDFALYMKDARLLESLARVPLQLDQPLSMEGYLDGKNESVSLQVDAPSLSIGGQQLDRLRVFAACNGEGGEALVQAQKPTGEKSILLNLQSLVREGNLRTDLQWVGTEQEHYFGSVAVQTQFSPTADQHQRITATFLPTDFTINDTVWHIHGGTLDIADGNVNISACEVSHDLFHSARIDGRYSSDPGDSIVARFRSLDVQYILNLVNFDDVEFGGLASGTAVLKMQDGKPHADFEVTLPQLYFNHTNMGVAKILGDFDPRQKRLNLDAVMTEGTLGQTQARGYVSLAEKGINLHCYADRTPLGFINFFTEGILEDIGGRASGYFHLYGPFKKLEFGGQATATADFTLPVTGVRYHISSGEVEFLPGVIAFKNAKVDDHQGGEGIVNGQLLHEHIKNMRYNFQVDFQNMLVYDMPQQIDWNFYSTAYGTGHLDLRGQPGRLQADIEMTPTQGTDFTFINDTPETVVNGGYVHFGSKRINPVQGNASALVPVSDGVVTDHGYVFDDATAKLSAPTPAPETSKTDIYLNFNVNVNPSAALHIIMDEKAGDVINLYARGNVHATYYNKGDFRMYGNCLVDHGEYRFSIQDIIRKNFILKEGGEVVFTGNPMEADLAVQAAYTVNSASLADLNAGASFSDNNVRVNCLLNITGKAGNPQVSFDLDLPTVNEDEKQMVRKLIATEEDMNMQIIYLLGVGRFYTYNASSQTEGTGLLATNSVNSFISNTLSSQLNEIIANAMQNNNWTFGANFATGNQGWNDMEVEALLSGRLFNNRLLLNGQFGYRDKATLTTTNNFIGDFDLQYLVNKSGNIRLKAYSETNDRYFTKSSLTTQGIGIMLQRDFGRLQDMVRLKKKERSKKQNTNEQ